MVKEQHKLLKKTCYCQWTFICGRCKELDRRLNAIDNYANLHIAYDDTEDFVKAWSGEND